MNFFQQQLKWILGNQPEFQDAKYVGRACFVPLTDGTRIKAELITRGTHEKYEALKLTAMNKAEGQIGATILEFKDYFATQKGSTAGAFTPHIWIYREKPEWYGTPRDIWKRKGWGRRPASMSGCSRRSRQHRPAWNPICRKEREGYAVVSRQLGHNR